MISGDLMVSPPSTSCHRSCTRYAADEFDPDRFLDERVKKYLVNNSFIFLPFNAGPRICLGQQVRLLFIVPNCFDEIAAVSMPTMRCRLCLSVLCRISHPSLSSLTPSLLALCPRRSSSLLLVGRA